METLFNNQWSTKSYSAAGETSVHGKEMGIDPETLEYGTNKIPTEGPATVIVDSGMTERTKWIIGGSIAGVLLITAGVFLYKRLSK